MSINSKRVLITGKNSYIGTSFIEYCKKNNADFKIDELSVHGDEWKKEDFSKYDIVLNVAGIAHRKETDENKHLYYEVNRDLAIDIADKAKHDGVMHHVFISTVSVYGISEGYIDKNTPLNPVNAYGKSKLEAEEAIKRLASDEYLVSIIRPPMIYGPNCKGNYQTLRNFAKTSKIFPNIENKRSMLFIDNFSEFLIGLISNPEQGVFYPQNKEYVSTKNMVSKISNLHNNKILFISTFTPIINNLNINIFKKVFGNLVYDKELSKQNFEYQIYDFEASIEVSENE